MGMGAKGALAASVAFCGAVLACGSDPAAPPASRLEAGETSARAAAPGDPTYSKHLAARLVVPEGVFPPAEADNLFLPFMKDHADLFPGKRVLDIGSGSGVIALYAARLGARAVVATDIDPAAIDAIRENARRLGLADVVSARLVPADDTSAFSVLEPDESFDFILSNPPYSLDLDAARNTPLIDTGDLGFSILRGLDERLTANGAAVLLYNSLFYHRLMVELARHLGHPVRHHDASGLTSWELEALFNGSLRRVLDREGLAPDAFAFDDDDLPMLRSIRRDSTPPEILIDRSGKLYPGLIVVNRSGAVDRDRETKTNE